MNIENTAVMRRRGGSVRHFGGLAGQTRAAPEGVEESPVMAYDAAFNMATQPCPNAVAG